MPSGIYSENVSANTGSTYRDPDAEPDPPAWSHWLSCIRCRRCRRPVLSPWAVDAQRRGIDWQQCVRGRGHWERTNQGIRLNHHVRFPSWDLPDRTGGFAKYCQQHYQCQLWLGTSWPGLHIYLNPHHERRCVSRSATLGPGGAGDVNVQAATIILTGGAAINSSTFGSGPGGIVSVTASEQLSISGQ